MKTIILSILLATSFCNVNAQKKTLIPIADETFLSASGQKNIKVQCSSEKITSMILKKFSAVIIRYNVAFKKDRMGKYAEYTIYFTKEDGNNVYSFLKSL